MAFMHAQLHLAFVHAKCVPIQFGKRDEVFVWSTFHLTNRDLGSAALRSRLPACFCLHINEIEFHIAS